ncbi:MAG: CcmD family protein [Acidobacteria bacterium]|nr:CcmD family protein [Acidobacteriota bacterium]
MTSLFWAYAIVWLLFAGYALSISARQKNLQREIATLKTLVEQKGQAPAGRSRP